MATIADIKQLRNRLEDLENEYLRDTPPCNNKECSFYREKQSGNCSWSVLLEDCRDYIPNDND